MASTMFVKPKVKKGKAKVVSNNFDMDAAYNGMAMKFQAYRELCVSLAEGTSRHLIVRGDPGIGKSYEFEDVFKKYTKEKKVVLNKATGHMTPLAMYNNLYEYRSENDITMFDDCDSVFNQPHALNLLKAATDTKDRRVVGWGSSSKLVSVEEYTFHGKVAILTNVDMRHERNLDRFGALLDRVIYFDLDLTAEEKVARILAILHSKHAQDPNFDTVCNWMLDNYLRFGKQLSIRSAVKLVELTKISPKAWPAMAEATILPRKPYAGE